MGFYDNINYLDTLFKRFLARIPGLNRLLEKQREFKDGIPGDDLIALQRFRLFTRTTLVASGVICYAFIQALSVIQGNKLPAFIIGCLDLLLIVNFFSLPYHRKHKLAYYTIVLAGFLTLHVITYFSGGIRASAVLYMAGNLLIAYMLLGNRAGWTVAGLMTAHFVFFWYANRYTDWISYKLIGGTDAAIDFDYFITFLMASVILTFQMNYLEGSKNIVISTITDQRNELREKNRELKKLSIVASKADNAILITDDRGVVEWVNDGFVRLTGYSPDEIIGKKPFEVLHGPDTSSEVRNQLRTSIERKEPFSGELLKYRKDGSKFWTQVTMTSIVEEGGEMARFIFIESDITTRKLAEEKMSLYMQYLERMNKELDKFAHVLSHELKAPLRAIGNLAGMIEEEARNTLSPESLSQFEKIQSRVVRMEHMIDGIHSYTKASRESNKITTFRLEELVRDAIDLMEIPPAAIINIRENMPVVTANRYKLQQVFMNLIENAVKFNDKPDVQVEIGAVDKGLSWEFNVKDNGPGIDSRYHEKIFVIFQTLHARDDRESTGVGLAIVKKIVEDAGGSICVDSQRGQGAVFRFLWPKDSIGTLAAEMTDYLYGKA